MEYTWLGGNFPARENTTLAMCSERSFRAGLVCAVIAVLCAVGGQAQQARHPTEACCAAPKHGGKPETSDDSHKVQPADLFTARAQVILGSGQPAKGDWGLLIADAGTGQVLFERNADQYFVPASNMKLFTTALALAKLGPDYRFRTTLESLAELTAEGRLSGPLYLVGRGDPNLSNRKFPFALKEEFEGPSEKAIAELANAIVEKGIKQISGDIVGDESYFPRERYPNGWEIDDMVWEYGAAISAIVLDDNTVQLTLTPGEKAGERVDAMVSPPTPECVVDNQVVTSDGGGNSD